MNRVPHGHLEGHDGHAERVAVQRVDVVADPARADQPGAKEQGHQYIGKDDTHAQSRGQTQRGNDQPWFVCRLALIVVAPACRQHLRGHFSDQAGQQEPPRVAVDAQRPGTGHEDDRGHCVDAEQ